MATTKAPSAKKTAAKKATKKTTARKTASTGKGATTATNGHSTASRTVQVQARKVKGLAHDTAQSASELAARAKTKAHDLTQRGKSFVREHPAEAAGLAVAGLTVLGALLGRRKLGPVVKGLAGTALLAKVGDALSKRSK